MECGPPIYTLQVDVDPSVDQLILLHYVPADRPILLCLSNKKLVQDTEISHSCDNNENILIGEGLRMLVDQTAPADNFMVSMTLLSQVGVSLPGEGIFYSYFASNYLHRISRAFLLAQQKYAIHYQPNFCMLQHVRPSVWTRHA